MSLTNDTPDAIRAMVREQYGAIAARQSSCCAPTCCAPTSEAAPASDARAVSQNLGYDVALLDSVPGDANLGLGCGNPTALASLRTGEVVLDLGAGAGLDALIASKAVGPTGRVIGVDMTPEMLRSARKNAVELDVHGYVEFREGLIEALPVAAETVDVLISNCVINLSPDKPAVFREAFRALKPGGRLAVTDIVLSEALPDDIRGQAAAYVACVAGALTEDDYLGAVRAAGFVDVAFTRKPAWQLLAAEGLDPTLKAAAREVGEERLQALAATVWSYSITARKA